MIVSFLFFQDFKKWLTTLPGFQEKSLLSQVRLLLVVMSNRKVTTAFHVSGASSGIGAATAVLFAKMGATLSLSGRNVSNLEETAKSCSAVSVGQKSPLLIQGIPL